MNCFTKSLIAVVFLLSGTAQAATVDLTYDLDVAYTSADGIRDNTSTYMSDLVGSTITAEYVDGSSVTSVWESYSTYRAGITFDAIDLVYGVSGFDLATSSRLASLSFDLAPSGTIFDAGLSEGDLGNTPGTKIGYALSLGAGSDDVEGVVAGSYGGLVQLDGYEAGVDAFTELLIDFTGTAGGGLLGSLELLLDLDVLASGAADLTAVVDDITPVPLPAAGWLLLAALGGLTMTRRSKHKVGAVTA